MLSDLPASKSAACNSTSTAIVKMEVQQQQAASTNSSRKNTAASQQPSEEAHVIGNREETTYEERLARIKKQFKERLAETDTCLKKQIAAHIIIATANTWRKATLAHDNMDVASHTTASSSSDCSKSAPGPDSDDERSTIPDTDRTSYHGSDKDSTAQKLSQVLKVMGERYAVLLDNHGEMKQQLCQKDAQHQALQQKYAEQREQRLKDKQLVDDWSEEVAGMDAYCKEVESANEDLEDRLVGATEKHQVDIEAKEGEIVMLKTDQELSIAAKDVEIENWRRACSQKDSTLQETVAQLDAERNEIKRKANLEKKKIWRASKTKTDDLQAKLEAMETKTDRTVADFDDANSKNEETIISLKARNQQLEIEHVTMTRTLLQKFTTGRELQRVIEANNTGKEEAKELRETVRHLEQHVENLLDTIQNTEKDVTRHREAEQDIRALSNRAQSTIRLLEDKLALRKDQVRDLAKQLDQVQQGIIPAGTNCAALDAFQQENEELRNSLQAERDEKMEMQATLDRLDNHNMDLSIEYDIIDAELIEQRKSSSMLRNSTEAAMHELRMLRKVARGQQGILSDQDHRSLLELVSQTTEENKGLVEAKTEMTKRLQEIEQWGKTITDKCESEVMKAKADRDSWWDLYFNEAVPTTERLHAEIAALKAEKGEQHIVEPPLPANPVVYDRKFLPFATIYGLGGVPAHLIPSAVHDPWFGMCLSATEQALKTLRPQGWYPVYTSGKVWLARMVEPLSEEQAAIRIRAGAHNESLSGASSGRSSMSNTYAPRNAHFPTDTNAHNELPASPPESRTPFLTHISSKQINSPVTPGRSNRAAARREDTHPKASRASKPRAQAARGVARNPVIKVSRALEYQSSWLKIDERMTPEEWDVMDDELKMHWIAQYDKTEDD